MQKGEQALEDSRALEEALRGVIHFLQKALEEVDPPLAPVALWCLRELEAHDGAMVGEVAAAIGVVPSTVSRTADRLVAAGLISRRTGHGDRRQVALHLTGAGARVLAQVFEARARALSATVTRMDTADRAALLRGARAFTAASTADQRRGQPS